MTGVPPSGSGSRPSGGAATASPAKPSIPNADHDRIWLQPKCCAGEYDGRQWCQDNVFDDGECEDGAKATEYVRADRYYELVMEVSRKFDGEARHETALRYIREREAASAMSAGTAATTQIGAGLQPASAVAESETPTPSSARGEQGQ